MASQNLDLTQRTVQRLSAQQVRFVRMLELNAPELDEAVERELEDNPALADAEEETVTENPDIPVAWARHRHIDDDTPQFTIPDTSVSLYDSLYDQLSEREIDEDTDRTARFIIGSLDSNGYLSRSLQEIIDDMAFGPGIIISEETARKALDVVRSLDPPGIGAANLQESLHIQLLRLPASVVRDVALRIISDAYEPFTMKHRHRIVALLKVPENIVDKAIALILSLNPKPGAAVGDDPADAANVIIPDFIISNEDGNLAVTLNNHIPELRISRSFKEAMADLEKLPKTRRRKGSEFIVSRYNDARDFIRILTQRQKTMMAVMEAILKIQEEYFRTENIYALRPMMIKNIADITGLDFPTISRATNNKYVATPWGVFPLRFFFSDTIGDETEGGDAATNRKIEAAISSIVEHEDKKRPLSDRRIAERLAELGFDISRRTIAKYRDRQGIPVARLRKIL